MAQKKPTTKKSGAQTQNRVQVKNPITKRWVKVDTKTGKIVDTKKTTGPYKNVKKKK